MSEETLRAKFIAQYYGVENIAFSDGYERPFTVSTITINSEHEYLLLRDVSQLTDEEIKQLADICDFVPLDEMVVERNDIFIKVYSKYNEQPMYNHVAIYPSGDMFSYVNGQVHSMDVNRVDAYCQLLRGFGVIRPFTYLSENNTPVTLQPDELIAKGWVKLYS